MSGIFISYRREDSGSYAGRLYDVLVTHFDRESVFFDIDTIGPGEDFREVIQRTCSSCKVLLAVIGRQWGTVRDRNGKLRLGSEIDFVRIEIVTALQNGLRVIPVLVGGADMPEKDALPEDLWPILYRNAWDLSDKRFHQDVQFLVDALKKTVSGVGQEAKRAVPPPEKPSLFPLFGISLGETTTKELAKLGKRTAAIDDETRKPYACYEIEGIDVWYDEKTQVVSHVYLIPTDPMPAKWEQIGLSWQNSYDQWLSKLQEIGYTIEVEEVPNVKHYSGWDSFSAKVAARMGGSGAHTITLGFNYSRATTKSAAGTLYSVLIRVGD